MRKFTLRVAVILAALGCLWTQSKDQSKLLSIDSLLQLSSVVSSPPVWTPDGSHILFSSTLNKGGMLKISSEGGFPVRMPFGFEGAQQQRISPDGQWISYISAKNGTPEIWLWSITHGQCLQLTELGGRINAQNWSPDSQWIAFSGDRYGHYDIWKVQVPTGDVYRLTTDKLYDVYPTWTPDSKKILFVRMDDRWIDHDVIEISESGSNPRLIVHDTDFFDYREGRAFGFPEVSPNGKMVLFRSHRSGWINYWVVPLSGGKPKQIAPEEADQSEARWSPASQSIVYISNNNGTQNLCVVPAIGGNPKVLVAPEMGVCAHPEWSSDGSHISYTLETPIHPNDLFVASVKSRETKQLTYSIPAGNLEKSLVKPEKITFQSSDGLIISAYLYKPGVIPEGVRYPGLVWLHGGPSSQFRDTFQQHVQFFVQNGYVILQPNVRGSSGYGRTFEKANNKCWGVCDLKDVLAGAEYLKRLPYVEHNRMGVTGTSYGGILSMATIANAPDFFQAAIPISGDADWARAYQDDHIHHDKMWDYELGPLKENQELYRKLSPITYAERITTPAFLPYGEGRYPGSPQSKLFATALQKYSKVFRLKAYPGETYYVRSLENRRQMLLDMLDFFDQFLKDKIVYN